MNLLTRFCIVMMVLLFAAHDLYAGEKQKPEWSSWQDLNVDGIEISFKKGTFEFGTRTNKYEYFYKFKSTLAGKVKVDFEMACGGKKSTGSTWLSPNAKPSVDWEICDRQPVVTVKKVSYEGEKGSATKPAKAQRNDDIKILGGIIWDSICGSSKSCEIGTLIGEAVKNAKEDNDRVIAKRANADSDAYYRILDGTAKVLDDCQKYGCIGASNQPMYSTGTRLTKEDFNDIIAGVVNKICPMCNLSAIREAAKKAKERGSR